MITSWFYQLQNVDVEKVAAIKADIKVIDPTRDGVKAFTPEEISKMRNKGERIVAYISIGEAEDYRSYWKTLTPQDRAAFLAAENPDWAGNYKVKFWDPRWQRIVYKQLDAIISQGFDGVYLDIIDAYEYWEDMGENNASQYMKNFVLEIVRHCRSKVSGFWIIPQNGERLLSDRAYLNAINAIGIEDLAYDEGGMPKNTRDVSAKADFLYLMVDAGKPVLVVEYPDPAHYFGAIGVAKAHYANGFIPYVTVRALDRPIDPLTL